MFKRIAYDLPFKEDASTKFIPWVIALTSFVGCLFLLGILSFSAFTNQWVQEVKGEATLEIPLPQDLPPEKMVPLLNQITLTLKQQPGILNAWVIPPSTTEKLLEPWLGDISHLKLPFPLIFGIKLDKKKPIDLVQTTNALTPFISGAKINLHESLTGPLINISQGIRFVLHLILLFLILASIGSLVFSTYTGLIVHAENVKILMLVGAKPSYIAEQFQRHTLILALKGTLYNYAVLTPVCIFFYMILKQIEVPLLHLSMIHILLIFILVPVVITLLMTLTARLTVSYVLARKA